MAVKLIDPNATTSIEVEGTTFVIAQLNNGDKIALAQGVQGLADTDNAYNDLLRLVAKHIKRIEGFEGVEPYDVLANMASVESQQAIINAITNWATLTEDEAKNSESSSGTRIPSPTGDGQAVETVDRDDASISET